MNLKHGGFYRVNYDEQNWKLLVLQLKTAHELIEVTSRAALLDDSFNLGRSEIMSQTLFLDIASYLKNEKEPAPFKAAFEGLNYLSDMLTSDLEAAAIMRKLYTSLVEETFKRLSWSQNLTDANEM